MSLPPTQKAGSDVRIGAEHGCGSEQQGFGVEKWLDSPGDGRKIAETTNKTKFDAMNIKPNGKSRLIHWPKKWSWHFFVLSALMSPLAPLLADCLQSLSVVRNGIRFHQAAFWMYLDSPAGFCVFVGARAVVTFLFLFLLGGLGFRGRTVWICLVVLWTFADFALEPL